MKDFIAKNLKKVILISIVIFVLIFLLCFYMFYGSNDLFKLPFESEVWGTFSDWATIFATILSLYLIWNTLQSQLATQKSQLKLQEIETTRFQKEMKPKFQLFVTNRNSVGRYGDFQQWRYEFYVKIKENNANKVKLIINYLDNTNFRVIKTIQNEDFNKVEGSVLYMEPFVINISIPSNLRNQTIQPFVANFSFRLEYEDTFNNAYFQVYYFENKHDQEIHDDFEII